MTTFTAREVEQGNSPKKKGNQLKAKNISAIIRHIRIATLQGRE